MRERTWVRKSGWLSEFFGLGSWALYDEASGQEVGCVLELSGAWNAYGADSGTFLTLSQAKAFVERNPRSVRG